jgi:hypothetical protein
VTIPAIEHLKLTVEAMEMQDGKASRRHATSSSESLDNDPELWVLTAMSLASPDATGYLSFILLPASVQL